MVVKSTNDGDPAKMKSEIEEWADRYNWPPNGGTGGNVKLIYYLLLISKIKVLRTTKAGNKRIIYFDTRGLEEEWLPETLVLTPCPQR